MRENVDSTPTPLPVVIPQDRDSLEGIESPQSIRGRRSRLAMTLAALPIATAAVVAGPLISQMPNEPHRQKVRAALAEVNKKPQPDELVVAQSEAALKLFGWNENGGINVKPAKEIANAPGRWETLDANNYFTAEHARSQVQIAEDGKAFALDGENYSMVRVKPEDGGVYIVVGKNYEVDGDKRIGGALLMGGAQNDESSDLNKDGAVTQEELYQVADERARKNINWAFQPPQVVGQKGFEGVDLSGVAGSLLSRK